MKVIAIIQVEAIVSTVTGEEVEYLQSGFMEKPPPVAVVMSSGLCRMCKFVA
jgi:hypothetical protein